MVWVVPQNPRSSVNLGGKLLAGRPVEIGALARFQAPYSDGGWVDIYRMLDVVNNWRAAHSYPHNAATTTLKRKAGRVYLHALVSQRIKRLVSIRAKLERFPDLNLSQIQDIGGCRAIVSTVHQVRRLERMYTDYPIAENIQRIDDYIDEPRDSGYRGIHLIYKYQGMKPQWEGLKIEIQLRSRRMHAWATAVEIVGTFTQQALKASEGEEEWLRFFVLMASAIAGVERTADVPNAPASPRELKAELRESVRKLRVANVLEAYCNGLKIGLETPDPSAHWYVLVLDSNTKTVYTYGYPWNALTEAQARLEGVENEGTPGVDAVLASVDQVRNLKRAYPNYYLDSEVFLGLLHKAVA